MFKKIISYGLLFAMLASLPVNVSAANEDISENCIYVSAQGSDKNSGTKESPVKTIEAAQALVRELKQNSDKPITVYIRGGVYEFRKTTNFTDKDSGTETAPVKYVAYEDEEVIFTGARKINVSGFQKVTDTEILGRIPEESHNKVGVINLKTQGITKVDEFAPAPKYGNVVEEGTMYVGLFFNDKEQTLARYPNGANQTLNVESVSGKNICFSDDRPLRWVNAKDAYIMGGIKYNWTFARTPLLGIDTVNKQIIQKGSYDPLARGFWSVQNLIEELDAPGEYYVDEENLLLYFYPPYSVFGSEMEITTDNIQFFNIDGASNITFEGLQFQRIRRSAVILNECNNVDFINCTFKDIMMYGVYMQDCTNCDVTDSDFSVIGATGVLLSGGNETTLEPGNNSAVNCHIYRPGDKQRTYCPGVAVYGVGNKIINNEIHNAPHNAIFFDGFEHKITYNEIYDVVKECVDSGAIYGVWGIYKYGVEIAYNYLHDINSIIEDGNHTAAGIYLDDMDAGVTVHHNVLENVQKAIIFGGGASNKGHNNIIINCEQVADMDARGAGWKRAEAYYYGWNTIPKTLEKTPALKRYEDLNDIGELTLTHNNYYPFFAEVYDNLYYNCGAEPNVHDSYKNDENYFTKYENNITASSFNKEAEGIEFADEKNNNYAIKEGAAILEKLPGLAQIDFSKIGLVESKYRKKDDIKLGNFRQYYPFNGTTEISNYGTYAEWENCDNADYYRVTIAKDKEFKNVISEEIFQYNYANLTEITTGLLKQYWRVDAISNGRNHSVEKSGDYGVYSFVSTEYPIVDSTAIDNSITNATRFVERLKEGTDSGCVPEGSKKMIQDLLDEANNILAQPHYSQLEVDIQAERLNVAMEEIGSHAHKVYGNVDFLLEDPDGWYAQTEGMDLKVENGTIKIDHPSSKVQATYLTKPVDKSKIMVFNVDSFPGSGWLGIAIQARSQAGKTIYSGNDADKRGYLAVIKENLLELQKWDGTNKIYTLENTAFIPGEYNKIEFGAIDFGGGNRIVFNINGVELFDFVDFDMPIDEELYFTVYTAGHSGSDKTRYANITAATEISANEIFRFKENSEAAINIGEIIPEAVNGLDVNGKILSKERPDDNKKITFNMKRMSDNETASIIFRDSGDESGKTRYEFKINDDCIALYRYKQGKMQVVNVIDNKYILRDCSVKIGIDMYTTKNGLVIKLVADGETIMDAVDVHPLKAQGLFGVEGTSFNISN